MAIKKIPKGALKVAWKAFGKKIEQNLPTILHGVAIACEIAAILTAVKETPKAMAELDSAKADKLIARVTKEGGVLPSTQLEMENLVSDEKLTFFEKSGILLKNYWPTMALAVSGIGFTVGAEVLHARHLLGVTAASVAALKERDEVIDKYKELTGKKKSEEVEKELTKDAIMNAPTDNKFVYQTPNGRMLFHIKWGEINYFYSSIEAVHKALQEFREDLRKDGEQSVTDLYSVLDLPVKDSYLTDRIVWTYQGDFQGEDLLNVDIHYDDSLIPGEVCGDIFIDKRPGIGGY